MRLAALVPLVACGNSAQPAQPVAQPVVVSTPRDASAVASAGSVDALATVSYPDLATALTATIPADARVIGFGELHARTDRAAVRTTLARFTSDGLPAIRAKLSDLVIETWLIDKGCEQTATTASAQIDTEMKHPVATKNDIAALADAARAAGIQPHAMRVTCADYAKIAPPGKAMDVPAMLTLTTSELGRIASEAVVHRDREPDHKPWIALYGGALHNDRFPADGVADWSYAATVDQITHDHFVEIDLIVPELADHDDALSKQPWYALLDRPATTLRVWKRGKRSFVIVFPRSNA
ncbi:MAG TPA: hypothetical protein VGG28_23675 [Kofleriaceae bacterium]